MITAKEIFNELTWISDYWDGESISLNKDKLEFYLEELEEKLTSHNKDCAVTVDKQPSPKSADADFAQS
jgi:hypothetical protein